MTARFYAILTNQGAARLANATALGVKLNLTQMAVGDGDGALPTPEPAQTALVNQQYMAPLNQLITDPQNPAQLIAELIIPENIGGFWIREIGLYDDEAVLIAVANCAETYKPKLQEGSGRVQTIRMVLTVTNTDCVTLKIDPSVVLATRKYVDEKCSYDEDKTYDSEPDSLRFYVSRLSQVFSRHGQHVEHYYDKYGDWDEAIFQAQYAVYEKKFSPRLIFPTGVIDLKFPILGAVALGDHLNERWPGFYLGDGRYKATWPLIIEGVPHRWSEGGTNERLGTLFRLSAASADDRRWQHWGIIHAAPGTADQFARTAPVIKRWSGDHYLRNFSVMGVLNNSTLQPWMHGVVAFNGHSSVIDNISVYNVWGGGIVYDWFFDSVIRDSTVIRAGRMMARTDPASPDTDIPQRTLYAPLQFMMSPRGSGTVPEKVQDNTNFIRCENLHFEDNQSSVDIAGNGRGSPIWLKDLHFETGAGQGGMSSSVYSTHKTCVYLDGGISQFMGDETLGLNRNAGNHGCYITWSGGAMYSPGYKYLVWVGSGSELDISNLRYPNSADLMIHGGNIAAACRAESCTLGAVTIIGSSHKTPFQASGCTIQSVNASYCYPPHLDNCTVTGTINLSGLMYQNQAYPVILSDVKAGAITGDWRGGGMGAVWLTYADQKSTWTPAYGTVTRVWDAYQNAHPT